MLGSSSRYRRIADDESGVTALEFSLLSPFFLIILVGLFQTSIAVFKGNTAKRAVARTARLALVTPNLTEASLQQTVDEILARMDPSIEVDIDLTFDNSPTKPTARISGKYTYEISIPFVPAIETRFDSHIIVPRTPEG